MNLGGHKHSTHNRMLSKHWMMNEREVISLVVGKKKDITDGTGQSILEQAGKGEAVERVPELALEGGEAAVSGGGRVGRALRHIQRKSREARQKMA